jgi:hypothetical protein
MFEGSVWPTYRPQLHCRNSVALAVAVHVQLRRQARHHYSDSGLTAL